MNIDISIKDAMPEAIEEMMEIAVKYRNRSKKCTILNRRINDDFDLHLVLNEVATHYMVRVLEEHNWNSTKCWRILGFNSRQTCQNWMRRLNLKKPSNKNKVMKHHGKTVKEQHNV
tara:strand:- start:71 stop:418 length:348 start_codon:yes stop_codon:yes gene_type:complete